MLTDDDLKRHPLLRELVPLLAAAPVGDGWHSVRLTFHGGRPAHWIPSYLLPAVPAAPAALYALPWPPVVTPQQRAACAEVRAKLAALWERRADGALVIVVDTAGQPAGPVRYQGPVPVSAAARERLR